jgi:hypothetical protein
LFDVATEALAGQLFSAASKLHFTACILQIVHLGELLHCEGPDCWSLVYNPSLSDARLEWAAVIKQAPCSIHRHVLLPLERLNGLRRDLAFSSARPARKAGDSGLPGGLDYLTSPRRGGTASQCHWPWVTPESGPDKQSRPQKKKPRQTQTPQDDVGNIITRAFAGTLIPIRKGADARPHIPKQAAAGCCTNEDDFTYHNDQHETDDRVMTMSSMRPRKDTTTMVTCRQAGVQSLEELDRQLFEQMQACINGNCDT